MTQPRHLAAVVFPGFEMLDLFGPLEMFSALGKRHLEIHMVAEQPGPVPASLGADGPTGPAVVATHGFDTAQRFDLLLIPGGAGTRTEIDNPAMLDFLTARCATAELVATVCTGSALLAKTGVLDGHRATSNKQVFALATQQSAAVTWVEAARWVEDGRFVTSSGVTAGMDMSLAIIAKLYGEDSARKIARYTEYCWQENPDEDPFADDLNELARKLGMV